MTRVEASALVASLFENWYSSLVRYVARTTQDPQGAEDIVQESFLRLYRELRSGKEIRNPRAWTLCVARHETGRVLRERCHDESNHDGTLDLDEIPDRLPRSPDREIELDELSKLLQVLTRREEEVVLLRMASMTYREIAGRLGISSSAVNTLLARALRKLQDAVQVKVEGRTGSRHYAKQIPSTLQ
ncbi:MAG TPA: sigma-70 family RNA polymerase sigma factor [Bryobacteraceae bacterium]|nr:sigma-70 family RNA polymerase sigma factor [Bryobacteraceae bacterium]